MPGELPVKNDQGRQMFPFIAELPVGVILDDRHALSVSELYQLLPTLACQRHPRRVVEIGEDIDEFRAGAQCGLKVVRPHPLIV